MNVYSYVIVRDYGFAPNPFGHYCTLACCKAPIRKYASVGDWVVGTGSKHLSMLRQNDINREGYLVYAMKVTEIVDFATYWEDERFHFKRPVMNGSKIQVMGDNIYRPIGDSFDQIDSHHSKINGVTNLKNKNDDLSGEKVLISEHFYYLGNKAEKIPVGFRADKYDVCKKGIGYKRIRPESLAITFLSWIESGFPRGISGNPHGFEGITRNPLTLLQMS